MKLLRKFLALLLSLMMVLTVCPVSAFADGPEDTSTTIIDQDGAEANEGQDNTTEN